MGYELWEERGDARIGEKETKKRTLAEEGFWDPNLLEKKLTISSKGKLYHRSSSTSSRYA